MYVKYLCDSTYFFLHLSVSSAIPDGHIVHLYKVFNICSVMYTISRRSLIVLACSFSGHHLYTWFVFMVPPWPLLLDYLYRVIRIHQHVYDRGEADRNCFLFIIVYGILILNCTNCSITVTVINCLE